MFDYYSVGFTENATESGRIGRRFFANFRLLLRAANVWATFRREQEARCVLEMQVNTTNMEFTHSINPYTHARARAAAMCLSSGSHLLRALETTSLRWDGTLHAISVSCWFFYSACKRRNCGGLENSIFNIIRTKCLLLWKTINHHSLSLAFALARTEWKM